MTVTGDFTEFSTQRTEQFPTFITTGGDGNLWFTEELANQIGRMDTNGNVTYFTPPTAQLLYGITTAPDGLVWFTGLAGTNKVGRIDANGNIAEFGVPADNTGVAGVTVRPLGDVYFTENDAGKVGQMTTAATPMHLFPGGSFPIGITTGPDGNIWFAISQSNAIGRIDP